MKPHYRYFWDYGQYGLYLGTAHDGVPRYLIPEDQNALYEDSAELADIGRYACNCLPMMPSAKAFFAYEENPRLH